MCQSFLSARQRGQVVVEFALVALVLFLLLAAAIEFGRAYFCGQVVQSAADTAARELSRLPLPADTSLTAALNDPLVRSQIFDDRLLVVDLAMVSGTLDDYFAQLPLVNQALRPAMIFEDFNGRRLLRYPGQLLNKGDETGLPPLTNDSGLRVAVYQVNPDSSITAVPVLEPTDETADAPYQTGGATPPLFSIRNPQRGVVAVRINFPYQAAALTAGKDTDPSTLGPDQPLAADDSSVQVTGTPPSGTPAQGANEGIGPYSGEFGLGRQAAYPGVNGGQGVRPFRKLLIGQAVYRREIFE